MAQWPADAEFICWAPQRAMHHRHFEFLLLLGALVALTGCRTLSARQAERIACATNMSAILIAARQWSLDEGDWLPQGFISMSNLLTSPLILHCPGDRSRHPISDWASLTPGRCSYQILNPGGPIEWTNSAYLRCKVHGDLLGYPDGRVFEGGARLEGGRCIAPLKKTK
ncbi:MAG: hypothetical protein C5B50_27850 [Verrucomicrobia bacterium]|nr:MAG: hypothetical protein C5B50_27850 [Verrucomicrobiota bacterium]